MEIREANLPSVRPNIFGTAVYRAVKRKAVQADLAAF
jgi:hypothetical protein